MLLLHTVEGSMLTSASSLREFTPPADGNNSLNTRRGPPGLGLLVADARLKLLSANNEAVEILTYPGAKDGRPQNLAEAFDEKIGRSLARDRDLLSGPPRTILINSGRRTYFCRAFLLDGNREASGRAPVVMVLERRVPQSLALSQVSEQFHLTPREQQAVDLLLQGLCNKEMAERMGISANTVKALLRLVMVKMRVSNRSAVMATILNLMLSGHDRASQAAM